MASVRRRKPKPITYQAPVPTERQEQKALIAWCDRHAAKYPELGRVYAIPNAGGYSGGFRSNVVRVIEARRQGVRPGYPDLGLDVPRGVLCGLRIELKRVKGGKASTEQGDWVEWLRSQHYRAEVCKGWEAARDVILDYLGIADPTVT
jgi:hypothetical protein